jgi:hypothetical protein
VVDPLGEHDPPGGLQKCPDRQLLLLNVQKPAAQV